MKNNQLVALKSNLNKTGIRVKSKKCLSVCEVIWDGKNKVTEIEKDKIILIKSI